MGRTNHKTLGFLYSLLLILAGCVKDKPGEPSGVLPPLNGGKRLLIACEGSLGTGNGALSYYRPEADSVYADVFKAVNNASLGDIFQSISIIGDQYLLCVNNSDKIIAINRSDFKLKGMLSIPKPRYILPLGGDKAYVSTLFSNKVFIINTTSLQITGSFEMPAMNPEGMLLENGKVFICTWDTAVGKMYVVDAVTDRVEDEIPLAGSAAQEVLKDKEGKLWVLSGNVVKGKQAALTCIDPDIRQPIRSYSFETGADPLKPVFSNGGDTLYFIEVNYDGGTQHNGIYRMDIHAPGLPDVPLIPAGSFQYYWALGIEPGTGNIYVGDPKGFSQKGSVYVYDNKGLLLKQFNVGVGPGHFYFDY